MSRMPASDCCSDSRLSVVATCACSLQRRSAGRTLRWTASVATVRSPPATSVTAGSTSSSAVMSPMATIGVGRELGQRSGGRLVEPLGRYERVTDHVR